MMNVWRWIKELVFGRSPISPDDCVTVSINPGSLKEIKLPEWYSAKLAVAKNTLGERYVLHPARYVKKGKYEPVVMRADIAATFRRLELEKKKEGSNTLGAEQLAIQ